MAAGGRRGRRADAGLDADTLMRARTAPVAALLFGSGFCALVYQVGWLREFRLIFGASTAASAAVLAIFIGGLGVGGLLLGPRADRHPAAAAASTPRSKRSSRVVAALSPLLLAWRAPSISPAADRRRLGLVGGTVERLVLSVIVLAVPTIAMGGTLPAAARAVTRAGDARRQRSRRRSTALNTLGAVAGCLVATFFLLEIYGTRATLWLAAALNMLVAVVARAVDRGRVRPRSPAPSRRACAHRRCQPCLPFPPSRPARPACSSARRLRRPSASRSS